MWIWKFYLPHQYPKVEQWLTDMALQGWRLAEHRRFRFRFEQHDPKARRFLYMLGGSRENDILSVVVQLKSGCHALDIPCGRFTTSTLLMLPKPEMIVEVPELMKMRRREHGKYFLLWAVTWLVLLSPIQVGIAVMDSMLRWVLHGVFVLPALTYLYAACWEVRKK